MNQELTPQQPLPPTTHNELPELASAVRVANAARHNPAKDGHAELRFSPYPKKGKDGAEGPNRRPTESGPSQAVAGGTSTSNATSGPNAGPPPQTNLPAVRQAAMSETAADTAPTTGEGQDVSMEPELELGPAGDGADPHPSGFTATETPANPHFHTSQMGDIPTLPPSQGEGFTAAVWRKVVITRTDLFKGIRADVLSTVLARPDKYLLLLPYGAGQKLHNEFPELWQLYENYLRSFNAPGCESLDVTLAEAAAGVNGVEMYSKEFRPPWVFVLSGISEDFRKFLLYYTTFDFVDGDSRHAFTVLEVNPSERSWHVTYLKGKGVSSDAATMGRMEEYIKKTLTRDQNLRNVVQECYAGRKDHNLTTTDEMMADALSTMSLECTSDIVDNKTVKFWHLTIKPITDSDNLHRNWLDAIRLGRKLVVDGLKPADAVKGFRRCDFCKNETHPEATCPIPRAVGWKGPSPQEVRARWEKSKKKDDNRRERGGSPSRGTNRRGGEPYRGRGRGGFRRRGWNTPY